MQKALVIWVCSLLSHLVSWCCGASLYFHCFLLRWREARHHPHSGFTQPSSTQKMNIAESPFILVFSKLIKKSVSLLKTGTLWPHLPVRFNLLSTHLTGEALCLPFLLEKGHFVLVFQKSFNLGIEKGFASKEWEWHGLGEYVWIGSEVLKSSGSEAGLCVLCAVVWAPAPGDSMNTWCPRWLVLNRPAQFE